MGASYVQGFPGVSGGPSVHIEKAENGYMVTLTRGGEDGFLGMVGMPFERPEPDRIAEIKKERERARPRVFVYAGIEDAWNAVKEFLLDGRMPKAAQ